MAFDFPASPSIGATYTVGTKTYVWDGEKWILKSSQMLPSPKTARTRNLFVNPAGQVSQEMGNNGSSNVASLSQFYPFDQFVADWNLPSAACNAIRSPTALSGGYNILQGVVTPKVTLAAGDYMRVFSIIEGLGAAALRWPGGDPAVARFRAFAANPGTYTFCIRNGPSPTRSFIKAFTLPASQWTDVSIPVPAPADGTWTTDNSAGLIVSFAWAAGSTFTTAAEGWGTDGTRFALAGQDNGARAAGNFFIGDFGLHPDPDNTGVAPPFQIPDYETELVKCMRYFQKLGGMAVWGYVPAGTTGINAPFDLKVPMRVVPTAGVIGWQGTSNLNSQAFSWLSETGGLFGGIGAAAGMAYMIGVSSTFNARM